MRVVVLLKNRYFFITDVLEARFSKEGLSFEINTGNLKNIRSESNRYIF